MLVFGCWCQSILVKGKLKNTWSILSPVSCSINKTFPVHNKLSTSYLCTVFICQIANNAHGLLVSYPDNKFMVFLQINKCYVV